MIVELLIVVTIGVLVGAMTKIAYDLGYEQGYEDRDGEQVAIDALRRVGVRDYDADPIGSRPAARLVD